jgi:putative DNA methylase
MLSPAGRPRIDTDFDVAFANELARYETYNKHHYRPNTYLHKWWGRRCGTTFRLILKGLVDDPALRDYYSPGGLAGKVILDPMMGGGTTLHEAIRLGASVMWVDVDPIPVLQARATLTERPLAALEEGFRHLYDGLSEAVGDLFQTYCPTCDESTPLWHVFYGLRRRCACGEVVVVDSLTLRHEIDGAALRWCPHCAALHNGGEHECRAGGGRLVEKGQAVCEECGRRYEERLDRPFYARYVMLAVAGHCAAHGLFHKSPDPRDEALLAQADDRRASLGLPVEAFGVEAGDKSIQLIRRGVTTYLDLFSSRQLAYLAAAIRHLPDDDAIVRLNLALLVSTSLEFNSMLCGYKGASRQRAGAVRHAFSHHGYSFPHTAVENNPIYPRRASGTLQTLFHNRIARGRRWAAAPTEREPGGARPRIAPVAGERDIGQEVATAGALEKGERRFFVRQGSAGRLPVETGSIDAVVTDPPYYDSIQYGDLAAFFRVWLSQMLPRAADWAYDGSAAAVSSKRAGDGRRYAEQLGGVFRECRRTLRPGSGRLIFTFHHWQPRAWAALTLALYGAGFRLLNRYVVHAENPMSVHISHVRALTHDAILVLAAGDGGPDWERPGIDAGDSYAFTAGCATFLGWVLGQPGLSVERIEELWNEAIVAQAIGLAE